jgi:YD repeat-containing protein
MLVTPSGGRVELRQLVGGSPIYYSGDSSNTLLTETNNGATRILQTKDGTQYTFLPSPDGEFRCVEIKDRNGNYISATYNGNSDISTMTDTLGRTIQFNYDPANYLTSISQSWTADGQPQLHEWARFTYSFLSIRTNFPGLSVQGPNNTTIPVLKSVTLADDSSYNFEYTSWGQVYQIGQVAADGHQRARTTYNLPQNNSNPQSDCPRFTERTDWAEYSMEVVTR